MPARRVALAFVWATIFASAGCLDGGKGTGPGAGTVASTTATAGKKTWTREEFRKLVMGKTEEEVIAAVGRPERTYDGPRRFVYYDRVIDPLTGKADQTTSLDFADGVVINIR